MIGRAKAGKKALPTGGAEVGKGCAVGACGSDSVSGVSALLSRFTFPRLSSLLCGVWMVLRSLQQMSPVFLC